MNWLLDRTAYLTIHGSQCYGMATEASDIDAKGICLPPRDVENDLFHTFEQAENHPGITEKISYLRNPQNPKLESVIYSLKKFIKLAAAVNPNVIELLYTDSKFHIIKQPVIDKLFESRDIFISARAKFTFSGYAHAQLAKIERHRKWLKYNNQTKQPSRRDYGLPEKAQKELEDVFRYAKRQVEEWNLSELPLDENERGRVKELTWEVIKEVSNKNVGWDNYIQAYTSAAINKLSESFNLKEEIIDLIKRENQYRKDLQNYNSWLNWVKHRNPARKALEERSGYDTKHASQLVRLLRMGSEILKTGKVIVLRPDAKELLEIKNGAWTYDRLIEYAKAMNKQLDKDYKITKLPKSVDYAKINKLYHELVL